MKAGTVTPAPMMTLKNGKALNIPRHAQTAQEAAEEKDDAGSRITAALCFRLRRRREDGHCADNARNWRKGRHAGDVTPLPVAKCEGARNFKWSL
jgi:hypothetical protein